MKQSQALNHAHSFPITVQIITTKESAGSFNIMSRPAATYVSMGTHAVHLLCIEYYHNHNHLSYSTVWNLESMNSQPAHSRVYTQQNGSMHLLKYSLVQYSIAAHVATTKLADSVLLFWP